MKQSFLSEIILALVIVVLAVLLLNPFGIIMPNSMVMMVVLALALVFILFAGLVFREKSMDEREAMHKMKADRYAFLLGSAVLVIGIIVRSFQHNLDNWLMVALAVMVIAKIVGLIYNRIRN